MPLVEKNKNAVAMTDIPSILDFSSCQCLAIMNIAFDFPLPELQRLVIAADLMSILTAQLFRFPLEAIPSFPLRTLILIVTKRLPENGAKEALRILCEEGAIRHIFDEWTTWIDAGLACGNDHGIQLVDDITTLCSLLHKWFPSRYMEFTMDLVANIIVLLKGGVFSPMVCVV